MAKSIYNLGIKLSPLLIPLDMLATIVSMGTKGLSWLASNLWVLVLPFTWFVYDKYKQSRK